VTQQTGFTGFGVCVEIGFGAFFQFEYLVSSESHVKLMCTENPKSLIEIANRNIIFFLKEIS